MAEGTKLEIVSPERLVISDTVKSVVVPGADGYFTVLGDSSVKTDAIAGLKSASGFIRSKAGKKLNLRFVPAIDFIYDDRADEASRIDALLRQVKE